MKNKTEKEKLVIRYRKELSPEECARIEGSALWKAISARYLYLSSSFDYYSEYHEGRYKDLVFFVFHGNVPVLSFWGLSGDRDLGYFHMPAEVIAAGEPAAVLDKAYKLLLTELERLIKTENVKEMKFTFDPYLVSAYFKDLTTVTRHDCIVNLELEEEQIRSNIRKSYKSLVNWGQRELQTHVMNSGNADPALYAQVREFHFHVAGRKTRSDASWQKHYEAILAGEGYLVIAHYKGQMASAAIVLHGKEEAFYGVGINDRKLMEEHPVSHYPLLAAILHAKSIGLKRFNMNEIDPQGTDEKVDNIAVFKKGFSKTVFPKTIYTVKLSEMKSTEA